MGTQAVMQISGYQKKKKRSRLRKEQMQNQSGSHSLCTLILLQLTDCVTQKDRKHLATRNGTRGCVGRQAVDFGNQELGFHLGNRSFGYVKRQMKS